MMTVLVFVGGMMIGGCMGIFVAAVCVVGAQADYRCPNPNRNK